MNNPKFKLLQIEKREFPDKNVLIVNINRLKKDSYIDANVSEDTLRVASLYIQDTIIERIIGTCLFNKLREIICEGFIEDMLYQYYKVLLDDYLFPVFVYGVQAEISIPLSFKNRNAGTIQNNSADVTQTGLDDIKYLNQYYQNKKDFYIKRAIDFLMCHCGQFPELRSCECSWCGELPMNKDYTTPLSLKKSWLAPQKRKRRF